MKSFCVFKKALPLLLVPCFFLVTQPIEARVSLADINAKLDILLAQSSFDIANHVVLEAESNTATSCAFDRRYVRIAPDGTPSADEFVVPTGFTLLLTDIAWTAREAPLSFIVGRTLRLTLRSAQPSGFFIKTIYVSPSLTITAENENGRLGTSETLRSGVAVGEGRIVCPLVNNFSGQVR